MTVFVDACDGVGDDFLSDDCCLLLVVFTRFGLYVVVVGGRYIELTAWFI